MQPTFDVQPIDGSRCQVVVAWPNGRRYETTVVGSPEQARWHAEHAIVPDMIRMHADLREIPEGGAGA